MLIALPVLFFVLIGHIWSIPTGLFLDDHSHYARLKAAGWSLDDMVASARLGIVGDVLDLWGRHESGLQFFRPVAFWLMKLEYTLAGWQPAVMHGFSLGWHFLCSMLVGALAYRIWGRMLWAGVAACLMAIHPGHTATVYWIACQTELMTTAFLLAATLLYAHHAGWGIGWFVRERRPTPTETSGSLLRGLGAVVFYALALGCRENALLFPLVCVAGDRLIGPRSRGWLRWEYLLFGAIAGAYLVLRYHYLGGFQMPGKPYLMPVGEPGFLQFILEKVVYYTIGMFGYTPVVPMGGRAWFASRPLTFYGGFLLTVLGLTLLWRVYRFRPALVWPVAWIVVLIAPVLPVFASSHHLYLPSVGAILLITAGLALVDDLIPLGRRRIRKRRPVPAAIVLGLHGVGLGLLTWATGFAYVRGTIPEDLLIRDVIERGPRLDNGDHLFFINIPIIAYYGTTALQTQLELDDLHGHVLTFSTRLTRMDRASEVEVIDAYTLRVRAPEGESYFEGVAGRTLLDAMGIEQIPRPGDRLEADLFDLEVTEGDAQGLKELVFRFKERLDTPGYRFYVGSPHFLAYPLEMARMVSE